MDAKLQRERELDDIKMVLASPQGRRFVYRLVAECRPFSSVMDQSTARVHYNAGKQDFGHFILSEVAQAQPDAFVQLVQEAQRDATQKGDK